MKLYHGTHKKNLKGILENGILLNDGYISLAFQFEVARGYAAMSGEKEFRKAGKKAKTVPMEDRIVVEVEVPDNIDHQIRGGGLLPNHEFRIFEPVKPEWIKKIIEGGK